MTDNTSTSSQTHKQEDDSVWFNGNLPKGQMEEEKDEGGEGEWNMTPGSSEVKRHRWRETQNIKRNDGGKAELEGHTDNTHAEVQVPAETLHNNRLTLSIFTDRCREV